MIKRELYLYGKGHANTITKLICHYEQTKDLAKVVDEKLQNIDQIVEWAFRDTAKNFVTNLFNAPKSET